eukprot:scaffold198309_cov52-Attheya_sp.AAC.2
MREFQVEAAAAAGTIVPVTRTMCTGMYVYGYRKASYDLYDIMSIISYLSVCLRWSVGFNVPILSNMMARL